MAGFRIPVLLLVKNVMDLDVVLQQVFVNGLQVSPLVLITLTGFPVANCVQGDCVRPVAAMYEANRLACGRCVQGQWVAWCRCVRRQWVACDRCVRGQWVACGKCVRGQWATLVSNIHEAIMTVMCMRPADKFCGAYIRPQSISHVADACTLPVSLSYYKIKSTHITHIKMKTWW